MRILIVAESDETVGALQNLFRTEPGYETFGYSLLLKALDNIEEINPDMVLISAADFPRHWKLFVRYLCSPLFQSLPMILLLTDRKFDQDERAKAKALGVNKVINEEELRWYDSIASLLRIDQDEFPEGIPELNSPEPAASEPVCQTPEPAGFESKSLEAAPERRPALAERVQCVFLDPATGDLVTGEVTGCGKNTFTFKPHAPNHFETGDIIDSGTLKIDGKHQSAILEVLEAHQDSLSLKVRKIKGE
jgi:hypothetical protein